ncbi:hypothetical protein GCM10010182_00690 [Actinomadura cremea]|nr:hypothetical protein GCM10010182_00690 [Actinomadura cremea]
MYATPGGDDSWLADARRASPCNGGLSNRAGAKDDAEQTAAESAVRTAEQVSTAKRVRPIPQAGHPEVVAMIRLLD